jgi:predicted regulator of Ras-like GTPase activity (Roadblock/LC7/MglB family)
MVILQPKEENYKKWLRLRLFEEKNRVIFSKRYFLSRICNKIFEDMSDIEIHRSTQTNQTVGTINMSNSITDLKNIAGFIGAALVDSESGLMLASEGGNAKFDIEAAGAANTEVVRAKNAAMAALGLDDHIEDILITLGTQLHLIRPLTSNASLFLYVALDRKNANLGMARMAVKTVEGKLKV